MFLHPHSSSFTVVKEDGECGRCNGKGCAACDARTLKDMCTCVDQIVFKDEKGKYCNDCGRPIKEER